MTLFENPFYTLGAAATDDRSRLRLRYDEKSLLSPDSSDDAFQTLSTPSRRLMAELCWFPGCDEAEILSVLSSLQTVCSGQNATPEDIIRLKSSAAYIGELNQLISILPYIADSSMDRALFEACRLLDSVDLDQLLAVINANRKKASIAMITSRSAFEDAFSCYRTEVSSQLVHRIRKTDPYEHDNIIYRIASFGTSPIIDAVMRDYESSVSNRLDQYEGTVQKSLKDLERFFNKDERPALIEKVQLMTTAWEAAIGPLRVYSEAIGSDSMIRDHENRMVFDLLWYSYVTLMDQGPDTQEIRLSLARTMMHITQEKEKYQKLHQFLKEDIAAYEREEAEHRQAAMAEKYRRLAEEAWKNEQKRNDEEYKKRAEDAAAQQREWMVQKNEAERRRLAEAVAEKRNALETERHSLQAELSKLRGLFTGKRRKQIEARLAEIDLELSKL